MNYEQVKVMFEILKNTLAVSADMLEYQQHISYQELLKSSDRQNYLGMSMNLKNSGSKVINLDLFKPENKDKIEVIVKNRIPAPDINFTMYDKPLVFVNLDRIRDGHGKGIAVSFLNREISGWSEEPLSLRTMIACVIVHELTHCQMDQEDFEDCTLCLVCRHCKNFYRKMGDNWREIIKADCLRKIDYVFYGVAYVDTHMDITGCRLNSEAFFDGIY